MKPDFQKITKKTEDNSFIDFWVKADRFGFHWHYHPEVEICFVNQGSGHRIIGESVQDFSSGDLVLVGSNLPHCWVTDEAFNQLDAQMEVYVIQFDAHLFFNENVEFLQIQRVLEIATRGISFAIEQHPRLFELLKQVDASNGLQKYLALAHLLGEMCTIDGELLCSDLYKLDHSKKDEKRVLAVCNHIHDHFKEHITIDTLSGIAAMNPSSFCRFFKKTLGKTAVEYINELRISHACNQMLLTTAPIYQIAYESGFGSIAHFNKQFKKSTGKTPIAYRRLTTDQLV